MGREVAEAPLDAVVRRAQRMQEIPALVAGVCSAGGAPRVAAAGWAAVETRRVVSGPTQFRIGSITKTFTAAVVVHLAVQGQVDLEEPVETYLTGVDLGRPRLRHLLAHCGGVQREVPGPMWSTMQGPDGAELLGALREARPVDRPGARWHYSNLGYALLGQVIEAVTGRSAHAVINVQLLVPLGLSATTWEPRDDAAVGYRRDPYQDAVHVEPVMDQRAVGVGGQLWSTAEDMLTWGDALAGGAPQILPEPVVESMHTLQVMTDTRTWTSGWGLGLILTRHGDRVLAGHTGAMPGFAASLSIDRATREVTVALANLTRGADVATLSRDLIDQPPGHLLSTTDQRSPVPNRSDGGSALRQGAGEPAAGDGHGPWRPGAACPPPVEGMLGRWWCEAEETVFTWRDGSLHAHLDAAPLTSRTRFEHLGADHYRAVEGRLRGENLTVERAPDGRVEQLIWATYPFTRTCR